MAINYNPTTVSDGLVLALDAANTRSYPGSGTAWTDISYRGNNGTLTNGPTFVAPPYNEPFGGAGGVYFDGTGDYLSVADNAALQMGSGDFTVEFWINFSSIAGYQTPFSKGYTSAGSLLFQTGNGNGRMSIYIGSSNVISETGTGSTNTWIHYALVRSGTTLTLYRDGTSSGTATNSTNINNASTLYVGSSFTSPDYPLNGYISNLRVIKGTALYTSNFTPPRVLLSNIPNTSLLTCQGGTIRDASSNNFTITSNGDASAVSYAPYIKFDGTNDYVQVTGSITTSTATFIVWIRRNGNQSQYAGILFSRGTNVTGLNFQSSNQLGYTWNDASNTYNWVSGLTLPDLTWCMCALSVSASSATAYLCQSSGITSAVNSVSHTSTVLDDINVGRDEYSSSRLFTGNIAQVSIYNRALTAEEVLQNYNALKGRFGL